MKYSIVVVTFNSAADIGRCLSSVENHTRDAEVIVVDNASSDDTRAVLKSFPRVKTVFNGKNQGFSAATNAGIRISRGDYIILLNPDTEVFPHWADRMAEKFLALEGVGAVGPLSTNCIGYQSVAVQMKEEWQRDPDAGRMAAKVLANQGKFYENKVLIGFCMMVPREVLHHVGLLDERLFLGNDDLEFSWRLRINGYRLVVALDAFIAHEMQKSFKSAPKEVTQKRVQESTDALYRKLVRRYGPRNLPTDMQLWGVNWFKPSPAVQAEKIEGPGQRLNLLFAFDGSADSLPARWAGALREYNAVTTVGFSTGPAHSMDLPLARPGEDVVAAVERSGGFGQYDAFVWFESGLSAPPENFTRIPILTAGIFTGPGGDPGLFDAAVFDDYGAYRTSREKGVENIAHLALRACGETPPVAEEPLFDVGFFNDPSLPWAGPKEQVLRELLDLSDQLRVDLSGAWPRAKVVVACGEAVEAMLAGKAVLTPPLGDGPPVRDFHEGRHFVEYKNAKALAEKVRALLSHPDRAAALGSAASEAARKRRTYRIQAVRFSSILREYLSLPRAARSYTPPVAAPPASGPEPLKPPEGAEALLRALDGLQIRHALGAAGTADIPARVEEIRRKLKSLKVETPDPTPFFSRPDAGLKTPAPLKRYTQGVAGSPPPEIDLNALDDPPSALNEHKRLGRPFRVRFRNFQSAETLAALSMTPGPGELPQPAVSPNAGREHTFASAEALLSRSGLKVTAVENRPLPARWLKSRSGQTLKAGRLLFRRSDFSADEWERFFAREFILTVEERKAKPLDNIKVSIVILTFNQLEFTQACIDSIRKATKIPHELILVDNGSTDNTPAWLTEKEARGEIQKVVLNGKNLGVAAGWNQGIKLSTGNYILILNNDVIVSEGWLEAMLRCAESSPETGAVGPMTNRISGFQREAKATYASPKEFEPFALDYMKANAGHWWETFRLVGFCLLVKRAAMDKVGLFDERFGKGNFEDDDYCLRLREAGYRLMVAGDSFIHHFGSVSFQGTGVDWNEQMRKNKALFDEKWETLRRQTTATPRDGEFKEKLLAESEALIQKGDTDGAIGRLAIILEADPGHFVAHNLMGLCAWYKGKTAEAYFFFKKAVGLHPSYEDALLNFCDAALALGRPLEAVEAFEKALARDPSLKEISKNLAKLKMETANSPGKLDVGKVISARELNRKGEALIGEGLVDKAESVFKEILSADPENFVAVNNLGVVAWYRENVEAAFARFGEALALCPAYEDALVNLFDAALKLKRVRDIVPRFEAALVENPALNDARRILTLIRGQGEGIYSVKHYSEVSGAAEFNREGRRLLDNLKLNEATLKFLDSIEKHGENCDAYCGLGIIQFYRGAHDEAFALFRRSVSLNPLNEDALLNLHDAALKIGRTGEIKPLLAQALEIDPGLKEIRRVLEEGVAPG